MDLSQFTQGMLPKDPRFAAKYPNFDGRGVTVAIFDTGCDPCAPGCGLTPDGKAKFTDFVDSTGSGDVDMSLEVTPNADNEITGLSGRTLKLSDTWTNPTGKFRVGLKAAFDIFPGPLVSRLKATRAELRAKIEAEQEAALLQQISSHLKDSPAHTEATAQLKSLKALFAAYADNGPVLDCVSFHDGKHWRAVIDCKEDGDLTDAKPMAAYKHFFEFAAFSVDSQLNYSYNFYEDGDVLSIVVAAGSHGTHVAGIVGAYFPNDPDRCGNAPGCQMISVKIGDTALGTMETGPGLLRGVIAAAEAGCDLVNMSYGEKTSSPNYGRFVEAAQALVKKHGMIFVSSAGNAGPCLTTVGSPGGNEEYMIGVGAFVLPSMTSTQYGLATTIPAPGLNYQWSSRGPAADGAAGVSISACGGAYAPVPNWTLNHSQQMNGTSMSSPAACGLIALLLSGMKQSGIKYSPARVKAVIEATANKVKVSAPTALGAGVLDVLAAFEKLVESKNEGALDLFYKIAVYNGTLPSASNTRPARGIYIRDAGAASLAAPTVYAVSVQAEFPQWLDETEGVTAGQQSAGPKPHLPSFTTDDKVNMLQYITLESNEPTGAVVPAPFMVLPQCGTRFQVKIDTSKLSPGLHYSTITARLAGHPDATPVAGSAEKFKALPALFTVPVTIVVPEPVQVPALTAAPSVSATSSSKFAYTGIVMRHTEIMSKFFAVPAPATWAQIKVKATNVDAAYRYFVQTQQMLPQQALPQFSLDRVVILRQGVEQVFVVPVVGGVTMELCLAPEWASVNPITADVSVEFYGVSVNGVNNPISGAALAVDASTPAQPLTVTVPAPLPPLTVALSAEFGALQRTVYPAAASLAPLSARDTFPGAKGSYELTLTYPISLSAAAAVTPRVPALNGVLYEAPYDAQMTRVFNEHNEAVFTGDAWPSAKGFRAAANAKYTAVVCVRQESYSALEKLVNTPMIMDITLPAAAKASCYLTRAEAIAGSGDAATFPALSAASVGTAFLAAPQSVPAFAAAGDVLVGTLRVVGKNCEAAQSTNGGPAAETVGAVPVRALVTRGGDSKGIEAETKAAPKLSACAAARKAVSATEPAAEKDPKDSAKDAPKDAAKDAKADEVKPVDAAEAQLDMTLKYLSGTVSKPTAAWAIATALPPLLATPANATHIALNQANFKCITAVTPAAELYAALSPAVEAFVKAIDVTALAQYFGTQRDAADLSDDEKAKDKKFKEQRAAVADAYAQLTSAAIAADLAAVQAKSSGGADESATLAAVKAALAQLRAYAQASEAGVKSSAALYVHAREGKNGKVLETVATGSSDAQDAAILAAVLAVVTSGAVGSSESKQRLFAQITAAVAKSLGWEYLAGVVERKLITAYPYVRERYY